MTTSPATSTTNTWPMPKTKVVVQNDLKRTPYHPFQRYKVLSGGGAINCINSSAANLYSTASGSSFVTAGLMNANPTTSGTATGGAGSATTAVVSVMGASTAGLNLNALANVTALNAATAAAAGTKDGPAPSNVSNLATTPHCNSVTGLVQSSVVVVQEQPAPVRPMES